LDDNKKIHIRDAHDNDYPSVVRLNDEVVEQTSPMNLERLNYLSSLAAYFKVAVSDDQVVAFLLAMKNGASYQNGNYEWFCSRYHSFLYVDRIIVDSTFQGCGIGTKLYRDLFRFAQASGIPLITCEINVVPPNEISTAFHARIGFSEAGSQWICKGLKKVSMQTALVGD